MISLKASMTCRSKSYVCLAMRSAAFIKFLPARGAQCRFSHQLSVFAVSKNGSGYIFSTDPPYYDNVPYADLSDYFYVWLRRSLSNVYPHLLGTVLIPKAEEL